jgi:glycosyltransferase involved in cell wall biosynthesis
VVIAVFNGERFIRDAIRSVLSQEHPALELIVVDDGSTDRTAAAIAEFRDACYVHQVNAGQPAALNRGVGVATGELLAFNDADDLWTAGRLETQLSALNDGSFEAVYGHVEQFLEPDAPPAIAAALTPERRVQPSRLHTAMLVRRAAFDRVGAFREDLRIGSVVDWAHRAQQAGLREQMLEEIVLRRRLHSQNIGLTQKQAASDAYLAVARAALARRREKER